MVGGLHQLDRSKLNTLIIIIINQYMDSIYFLVNFLSQTKLKINQTTENSDSAFTYFLKLLFENKLLVLGNKELFIYILQLLNCGKREKECMLRTEHYYKVILIF